MSGGQLQFPRRASGQTRSTAEWRWRQLLPRSTRSRPRSTSRRLCHWTVSTCCTPTLCCPLVKVFTCLFTLMVGLKNGHIRKNLTQSGEPQRYSWGTHKKKKKKNPLSLSLFLLVCLCLLVFVSSVCLYLCVHLPPRWPSGKASTSRGEDPVFESRLHRDFFRVESYQ